MLKRIPISPSFVQEIGQETSAEHSRALQESELRGKEQDKAQNK